MKNNIIEIEPDENGKYFITLYGIKYQLVIKKPVKAKKENG